MNTDNAKYTVVEFINAFGTKAYALRSPSGVDIDTDYANEQKLQRRADDLNKEIEVASANLRNRNMELEAALTVTTESLNKANYEKYLLEVAIKDAIKKSLPKDTTLGDCAWALMNCREILQDALKPTQSPVSSDSDEQVSEVTLVYSDNPEMLDDFSGHDYDVDVVGWLAEHQITAGNLRGDFAVTVIGESIQAFVYHFCTDITPSYLTDECYFDKYFRLKPEFDTPANRAAIFARRHVLGLGV